MIIDSLNGLERYWFAHKNFEKVYRFLKSHDLTRMEEGRYKIDGDTIYAIVSQDEGRQPEEAPLEAHDSYIDIQVLIEGDETMGWKDRSACNDETANYNTESDIVFFEDMPSVYFTLEPMHAVVFFPHDAHSPMIGNGTIKKIVVKVKL
ncbi:MAG: YhcH/YjgK/YiaL family protein [Prevotellaceae bacterium]|nr:YhcH/YjgK/YiaL family protein [Prevotellaceae bacterium]